MKLKVVIIGPKVHDVGYRYLLMSNAIDIGLRGFHARNRAYGKEQEVIAIVEGDEEAIADFKALVEAKKPENSKVTKIAFEDYQGDVMRTGEYAQVCTALQLNKAIPVLLEIRDSQRVIVGGQDKIINGQKELAGCINDLREDLVGEIQGLREDLVKRSDVRLMRIEKDIKTIKSKIGIR